MKIGILQTGYVPKELVAKHGQYDAMFRRLLAAGDFQFETFVVAAGEFPESVSACDGWLLTGSSDGAYEPHTYIAPLEAFIRAAYAAEVPLAGICFGHQIMAQALGGKVVKHDGGWCLGQVRYQIDGQPIYMLAVHQDQVVTPPPEAKQIASSDCCANAGFAYPGKRGTKAISYQFHPEFTPQYVRDLISLKTEKNLPKDFAAAASATVQDENNTSQIAQQLVEFFLSAKSQSAAGSY